MLSSNDFFAKPVDMGASTFMGLTRPADWPFYACKNVAEAIQMLKDHVEQALKTYECPDIQTKLRDKQGRYKAMSAVQKAIRRGNVELAQRAGYALWVSGFASAFWSRFATASFEDVGIADPVPCAVANLLAAEKSWRAQIGEKKAMFWVIEQLCNTVKSRDACLFEVYADLPNCPQRALAEKMADLDDSSLASAAEGCIGGGEQFVAHWMIFGAGIKHKWFGRATPARPALVKQLINEWEIPTIVRAAMVLHFQATGGSMEIMAPLMWAMMRSSSTLTEGPDFLAQPDNELIGKVYAATFDKHVSEGKRAFGWFAKANVPIRQFCEQHELNAYQFVATAAFYVEGAVVDRHVQFDCADELTGTLLQHRMQSIGKMPLELTLEGFKLFQTQIPMLNEMRRKIVS
jgi:hypothetical protein